MQILLRRLALAGVLAPLAATGLTQEATPSPAPTPGSPAARALLDTAFQKMLAHGRGSFLTVEAQDSAMGRQVGVPVRDIEVSGTWDGDLIAAQVGESMTEVVASRGRRLAKVDGDWQLRGGMVAEMQPMPLVLDPQLLFTWLASQRNDVLTVAATENATWRKQAVTILGCHVEGKNASRLALSGLVPDAAGLPIMMSGLGGLGAALGGMPEAEVKIDLAFYVTQSGDVLRTRVRLYRTNPMLANIQIQGAGGAFGGGDDEEEEEPEEDGGPDKPLVYKRGIPKRKVDETTSVMTYDVRFSDLGKKHRPDLPEGACRLLGIPFKNN